MVCTATKVLLDSLNPVLAARRCFSFLSGSLASGTVVALSSSNFSIIRTTASSVDAFLSELPLDAALMVVIIVFSFSSTGTMLCCSAAFPALLADCSTAGLIIRSSNTLMTSFGLFVKPEESQNKLHLHKFLFISEQLLYCYFIFWLNSLNSVDWFGVQNHKIFPYLIFRIQFC